MLSVWNSSDWTSGMILPDSSTSPPPPHPKIFKGYTTDNADFAVTSLVLLEQHFQHISAADRHQIYFFYSMEIYKLSTLKVFTSLHPCLFLYCIVNLSAL